MKTEFIAFLKEHIGQHVEGKASPFSNWLNGKIEAISDNGDLKMSFEMRTDMLNPFGLAHGGVISAILDELMGMQIFVKSTDTEQFLALNLTVDFVKSVQPGEIIYGAPIIIKKGRRVATATCQLVNAKGIVIAQGSSNYLAI